MATTQQSLADADGDFGDWLEIENPEATAVNLDGWTLTKGDDASGWRFPALTLAPNGYVVVFASGKNRRVAGRELHTDFKLPSTGETLMLRDAAGAVVQTFRYEQQRRGLSFDGVDYLSPPTPGASNATATVAVARAPTFSEPHGFKTGTIQLTLSCATAGATVHYTLDGSEPGPDSAVWTKPLTIKSTTVVRAISVATGKQPSVIVAQSYLFVADMVKQSPNGKPPAGWPATWGANRVDYGMDPRIATSGKFAKALPAALKAIPTISLSMPLPDLFDAANGIYANAGQKGRDWERAASVELIEPDGSPGFSISAGLRMRGGASRTSDNPKHSFRVLLREEYGAGALNYPLFGAQGARKTERFDLRCEQLVAWHYFVDENADFIRDIYGHSMQGATGQPYLRSKFHHLVINGQYWGLYQTEERLGAEYARHYFGGEEDDYDTVKVNYDPDSSGTAFVDGSFGAWRRAVEMGKSGFEDNANYFAIQGLNADGTRHPSLPPLIDVDNLIDYMLAGIFIAANDSPPTFGTQNNWGGIRERHGEFGFRFFAHDWEISMYDPTGNDNLVGPAPTENPFLGGGGIIIGQGPAKIMQPDGSVITPGEEDGISPYNANPWHFWQAMRFNAEFRLRVADRVQKHFFNGGPMTQSQATARWREFMSVIDQAIIGESARWGDARANDGGGIIFDAQGANKIVGPGPGPGSSSGARPKPFTRDHWLKACNEHILNGFLADRSAHMLDHLRAGGLLSPINAPEVAPFGGMLSAGQKITLTAPFVSDGGSDVSASIYFTTNGDDPRRVGGGISDKAQLYTAPIAIGKRTTLKVRAWHRQQWSALVETVFEPTSSIAALRFTEVHYNPAEGDNAEFIELQNTGTTMLDLSGVQITAGVEFTFPAGTSLAPAAFVVLAKDAATFQSLHGFAPTGVYTGRLDNDGEPLTLLTASGARVTTLDYDDEDGWPDAADGFGFSAVYRGSGDQDRGENWQASAQPGGSPGQAEPVLKDKLPVVIDELIVTNSGIDVELRNRTSAAFSLNAASFKSGSSTAALPAGLSIPAEGRLLVSLSTLNGLVLSDKGGTLALQIAAPTARDRVHRFRFGPLLAGTAYGRYVTSDGREFFPVLTAATPGAINAGPLIPAVRISEIMYQPQPQASGGRPLPPDLEFIELHNTSTVDVSLAGWRLSGLTFAWPAGAVIRAGERVIVTPSNPDDFRGRYNLVADSVQVFGPAIGTLDDTGERLALEAPVTVVSGTAYQVVEELRYDDAAPWPVLAAGRGSSLHRLAFDGFAAEPASWGAAAASPASASTLNAVPTARLAPPAVDPDQPAKLYFEGSGSDLDGRITRLEFIVDGSVVDQSTSSPATFTYRRGRGVHDVWLRVTDNAGATAVSEIITLDDGTGATGAGRGLKVEYFANTDLSGTPAHSARTEVIGGDWFHLDPAPGVSRKAFSARWSGKLVPLVSGVHRFTVIALGGVRIFINGERVQDHWIDPHSSALISDEFTADFTGGEPVNVEIEYFDDDGLAHLDISWLQPLRFDVQPIASGQLYLPEEDPALPGIIFPNSIARIPVGRRLYAQLRLSNTAADPATSTWSIVSGSLPEGISLDATGRLVGRAGRVGSYAFTVRAVMPNATAVTRAAAINVLAANIPSPVLQVTAPGSVVRSANREGTVLVKGTVSAQRPLARLSYMVNGNALWHDLPPSNRWQFELKATDGLVGGQNSISIEAEDVDGRLSKQQQILFSRRFPADLKVAIDGAGSVTAGYLGITSRIVGEMQRLTATPAPGYIFAGWSGSLEDASPVIAFEMREDMSFTARFIPSPFTRAAGRHTGLLVSEFANQAERMKLSLDLTATGSFTGALEWLSRRFPFTGQFSATGETYLLLGDSQTASLQMKLVFNTSTRVITASAIRSGGIIIGIDRPAGDPVISSADLKLALTSAPARFIGRWNSLLDTPDTVTANFGTGYMTSVVTPNGKATTSGITPAGQRFTISHELAADGASVLYIPLGFDEKSLSNQSINGIVQWPTTADQPERLAHALLWTSAHGVQILPDDDFTRDIVATGSRWTIPLRGQNPWRIPNATLTLTGPAFAAPVEHSLTLGLASFQNFTIPGKGRAALWIRPDTGLIGCVYVEKGSKNLRGLSFTGLSDPGHRRIGGQAQSPARAFGRLRIATPANP